MTKVLPWHSFSKLAYPLVGCMHLELTIDVMFIRWRDQYPRNPCFLFLALTPLGSLSFFILLAQIMPKKPKVFKIRLPKVQDTPESIYLEPGQANLTKGSTKTLIWKCRNECGNVFEASANNYFRQRSSGLCRTCRKQNCKKRKNGSSVNAAKRIRRSLASQKVFPKPLWFNSGFTWFIVYIQIILEHPDIFDPFRMNWKISGKHLELLWKPSDISSQPHLLWELMILAVRCQKQQSKHKWLQSRHIPCLSKYACCVFVCLSISQLHLGSWKSFESFAMVNFFAQE